MFAHALGRLRDWRYLAPLLLLLAACGNGNNEPVRKVGHDAHIDASAGRNSACGIVIAGTIDSSATGPIEDRDPIVFSTTYVRDDRYVGMEDNDLRGFLDGAFKEGWNQVGQAHLRLGRRARSPAFGEYELFRNLQRWDALAMPVNAQIVDAELRISLESGPPYAVDVAIYAVRKDWNPGEGGLNKDNNSPPANGEVWWLDAEYGSIPWASAGAGYASDTDPGADTYGQPLALVRYEPGDSSLLFRSTRLASYVRERVQHSKPLLLLYKLTDPYEDSVGSVFEVWSANVGIVGSERRPRLKLRWHAPEGTTTSRIPVTLEPGRSMVVSGLEATAGEILAAGFSHFEENRTGACGQSAFLEYREAGNDWQPLDRPVRLASDVFDLRITAATRPLPLGGTIELNLRDTWIPVGLPEDHVVHWSIRRPDGLTQQVDATFVGDFTWRLRLPADIPGRWLFRWQHELSGSQSTSQWHTIDVVARELAQVRDSLNRLEEAIEASGAAPKGHAMLPYELAFMRLERAAAAHLAGSTASTGDEEEIMSIIRHLRESLSGREVPKEFVPKAIKSREAAPVE